MTFLMKELFVSQTKLISVPIQAEPKNMKRAAVLSSENIVGTTSFNSQCARVAHSFICLFWLSYYSV